MPDVPFARLQKEVLAIYRPPHRRESTWYKMRRVLAEFAGLDGVRMVSDITPLAITDWLATCAHRAPITNRSYLSSFRAACAYARRMTYLEGAAWWEVRRDWIAFDFDEEDEPAGPRHLTLDEIDRLMLQLDAEALAGDWRQWRLQALVYTYLHTGLRKSEALGLKVADVDLAGGLIRVRSRRRRKLKTRPSARRVGIPEDLAAVLHRWIAAVGSEWLFPGIRRTKPWIHGPAGGKPLDEVKAAGARAGVPHVTIQSFRRSLATHGRRLGLGPLEVQEQLGHGSVRTQDWYHEEDADALRDVARRISFRRPRAGQGASPRSG